MKILHLLDSLNRGGAETLALDVCKNAENYFDLTFVACGGGGLEKDFNDANIDFIRLQRRLPFDVLIIRRLRQIIRQREIQIVHAHQGVDGLHAYFATLGTGAKLVLSFHGGAIDVKNRFALNFLSPRTSANIICSNALRDWYETTAKLKIPKSKIIYNGVDEKRLRFSGGNLKDELKISRKSLLFGMIANFYAAPRKDQLTVCRALPRVFDEIRDAHFVFIGKVETGAESKLTECADFCESRQIIDRVHFLGVRGDVPDVLRVLDVFVLSSFHEGLPISVIEAMLAGLPVVLSDIKPHIEISNNGESAILFHTQNADDLSEKLLKLSLDADFRRRSGEAARQYAKQHFSIETHLQQLAFLYESLIK
ncbi:MAG: glycosyltransferase family 4 protein [Pyrinomonadaceae bacterium]|nr:glycosyltransferase family 4 protein [Pyrinomonadaceae bacterium]